MKHLADDVVLHFVEGEYFGYAGFDARYKDARKTFTSNIVHEVQQVEIAKRNKGQFAIDLRIKFTADTSDGKAIDLLVNEEWIIKLSTNGQILIEEYLITIAFLHFQVFSKKEFYSKGKRDGSC